MYKQIQVEIVYLTYYIHPFSGKLYSPVVEIVENNDYITTPTTHLIPTKSPHFAEFNKNKMLVERVCHRHICPLCNPPVVLVRARSIVFLIKCSLKLSYKN